MTFTSYRITLKTKKNKNKNVINSHGESRVEESFCYNLAFMILNFVFMILAASLVAQMVKCLPATWETWV